MKTPTKDEALPQPRRRMRALVLVLSLLGGLLLVEGTTRFLLFGSSDFAVKHGRPYRKPGLFADSQLEDSYWLLMHKLHGTRRSTKSPNYDPLLGWVNQNVEAVTYRHAADDATDDRRPLLFYGASYVQALEAGEVAGEDFLGDYNLLNYGVGGYGIDQAYLLMRETLDHYAGRDPLVLIGLVADSDFDRCVLRFRSMPKPRLLVRDGKLELEGPVIEGGAAAYFEKHGDGITSYAWRYLLNTKGWLPAGWRHRLAGRERLLAEQTELVDALVLAIRDELDSRGVEYGFVLFTGPQHFPPREASHREQKLIKFFDANGIPFVHMRNQMLEASEELGVGVGEFFIQSGTRKNHPNELGNRVILQVLRRRLSSGEAGTTADH